MRLSINKEQWERLGDHVGTISSFPATVSNFLQYFTEEVKHGNFNVAYDPERKIFGVWYEDMLEKFEDKELINAMFNMFCHLEEI